ncbi:MAG: hypothetical protein ACXWCY_15850 [Burkholderiales bacterium]
MQQDRVLDAIRSARGIKPALHGAKESVLAAAALLSGEVSRL